MEFWNRDIIISITSKVGKVFRIDENYLSLEKCIYARACVEVDLSKPLVPETNVADNEGDDLFFQPIVYEKIASLCFGCRRIGHQIINCEFRSQGVGFQVRDNIHRTDGPDLVMKENIPNSDPEGPLDSLLYGLWIQVKGRKFSRWSSKTPHLSKTPNETSHQHLTYAPSKSSAFNSHISQQVVNASFEKISSSIGADSQSLRGGNKTPLALVLRPTFNTPSVPNPLTPIIIPPIVSSSVMPLDSSIPGEIPLLAHPHSFASENKLRPFSSTTSSVMDLDRGVSSLVAGESSSKDHSRISNPLPSLSSDYSLVSSQIKDILVGVSVDSLGHGNEINCSNHQSGNQLVSEEEIQHKALEAKRRHLQASEWLQQKRMYQKRPIMAPLVLPNSS